MLSASVSSAEEPPGEARSGGEAIECANLIYAGTKSSVCFSDRFLSSLAADTTVSTSRKFKPVKLAGKELFRYPFAVMTGEGSFTLTEAERANLRRYLERGGFLLASAGCSSKTWDKSFRREIKAVFGASSLRAKSASAGGASGQRRGPDRAASAAERDQSGVADGTEGERKLETVDLTHAIFHTVYDIDNLDTKGKAATLEGLTIAGKIVLIYSPDGLNDTRTMHGCCCCGGNEIVNSQKINANILAYALMQ
jgi:hypothetical protein